VESEIGKLCAEQFLLLDSIPDTPSYFRYCTLVQYCMAPTHTAVDLAARPPASVERAAAAVVEEEGGDRETGPQVLLFTRFYYTPSMLLRQKRLSGKNLSFGTRTATRKVGRKQENK
jgi:hypothetical protein